MASRNSRREFLKLSGITSTGLALGFILPVRLKSASAANKTSSPNAFLEIDIENNITIFSPQSEMGQDVYTSMPMLVAEELEVDLQRVKIEVGQPGPQEYTNGYFGAQLTGASTSVRAFWEKMRKAGATARMMLVNAAASQWGVDPEQCVVQNGIIKGPNSKTLSYGEVAELASQAEVPKEVGLKPASKWKYIGNPSFKRLDTKAKVTGKAQYSIDVKVPGMLYASLKMPEVRRGKVRSFDDSRARNVSGVKAVVKLDGFQTFGGWVDGGVAVVADTYWTAKKAKDLVVIDWDTSENGDFGSEEFWGGMEESASTAGLPFRDEGNLEKGLAESTKKKIAEYRFPYYAHAPMEPVNCTADVRRDKVIVTVGHQFQSIVPGEVAKLTGLQPDQVEMHTTFMGGGFGRKTGVDWVLQATAISMRVGAPVNLIWSREDDMTHDAYRPAAIIKMEAGLDQEGEPNAMRFEATSPSISAIYFPPLIVDGIDPWAVEGIDNYPYKTPNLRFTYKDHPSPVSPGFFRGVSNNLNITAMECFIDECAIEAGKDPLDYRLNMLEMKSKKYPLSVYSTGAGISTGKRMKAVLEMLKEKSGWGDSLSPGEGKGLALMEAYNTVVAAIVEVSVSDAYDVVVNRVVTVVDAGVIIRPDQALAQVEGCINMGMSAALWGEITVEDGKIQQDNFDSYRVARINENPRDMSVHFIEGDGSYVGGLGEPVTAAVQPAIGNAIFNACGKRVRQLPFTPENINGA